MAIGTSRSASCASRFVMCLRRRAQLFVAVLTIFVEHVLVTLVGLWWVAASGVGKARVPVSIYRASQDRVIRTHLLQIKTIKRKKEIKIIARSSEQKRDDRRANLMSFEKAMRSLSMVQAETGVSTSLCSTSTCMFSTRISCWPRPTRHKYPESRCATAWHRCAEMRLRRPHRGHVRL